MHQQHFFPSLCEQFPGSIVPVPGSEGAWCPGLFDDVDGLVLRC